MARGALRHLFRRTIMLFWIFRKRGISFGGIEMVVLPARGFMSEGLLASGAERAVEMADVTKGRGTEGDRRPLSGYMLFRATG